MRVLLLFAFVATLHAACQPQAPGSPVPEPWDLRSVKGQLSVSLTIQNFIDKDGSTRYCYTTPDGHESPNLRLHPGDLLTINLTNNLTAAANAHKHGAQTSSDPCHSNTMSAVSTNLHFHGLDIPTGCHEDDVVNVSIQPHDPTFQYKVRIPDDEPPGLYWYHPHIHGFSKVQVLGGASGAIIIEGIESAVKEVAGLPERVLIIRDRDLINPNAPPDPSEPVVPKGLIDNDGDAGNNGTGFGKPAKDLSINGIPVPYPSYTPAVLAMKPGQKQLWRVLNASAICYLNLEVVVNRAPQPLGLVALDGVPINRSGKPYATLSWQTHLAVAPGSRVEFIVTGPQPRTQALLVTTTVDTGPGGENDPNRAIARIHVSNDAADPRSTLAASVEALPSSGLLWLGDVKPIRTRHLYFSEKLSDPNDPNSPTEFYLTVDGKKPAMFDPSSGIPDIIAEQGTVEDWIIENRSNELHAFHIHQLHFVLMDYQGRPVNEPYLRDTINVPYYNGHTLAYPSVRLRMDFRGLNTVGTFPYHCHLLEHEDNGMMGLIRVEPNTSLSQSREIHPR